MKKRMMKPKIFSFALALFIAFGAAKLSVYAEPTENAGQGNAGADLGAITYSIDSDQIDVSDVTPYSGVTADEDVEVDTDDPVMQEVENELNAVTLENDAGLTQEQISTVCNLFQQYLDQWQQYADVLGVQLPFFLSYNDQKDKLGILGEMLVLAGKTVDEVRSGDYSYDDLTGMIMNFLYADKYGVELYGDTIRAKRNEVLATVKNSGATTEAQKLLVINDWIAHQSTFDMAYIMNMGKESPVMSAPDGTDITSHPAYKTVHDGMYDVYEKQIRKQFHDQIYEGIVADLRQQFYEKYIWNIIYNMTLQQLKTDADNATDDQKQQANEAADKYIDENKEAISEDAVGFVQSSFGDNGNTLAEQMVSDADDFIADAKENGVALDQGKPDEKTSLEDITSNTMKTQPIVDMDQDGKEDTTANKAIPIYAEEAAKGLTSGIIGAWEGNHIGILAEGTGVCAGYSKAFAYLVQCMHPEIYGKEENADLTYAKNWKTPQDLYYGEDGNINIDNGYIVDMVRIKFKADVSMFGEKSTFGETHFWNAVRVGGQWYYVDPCYTDIYVECMNRDRVEIDGTMNHMYFMFSDKTARDMYEGNMEEIATLYEGVSVDKSYEDSWFARIASNTYITDGNAYYMYDSTDQLSMMREYRDMQGPESGEDFEALMEGSDPEYKLVYHTISKADIVKGGADQDFTTLIEFNPKDDNDNTLSAKVYNPTNEKMEENELITKLFAQYKDECDIYPSIKMTTALHNGKLYFNLSNCILSYDIKSGDVEKVKEYNTVYGKRDETVAFGGMAFSVCDKDDPDLDLSVTNHPIAALTIKDDGQMYVSVATNYAFISGKSAVDDSSSYGYEFEESNYNPDYSNYMNDFDIDDETLAEMGYSKETNDNDEFMWSAVFVDTINMSKPCEHKTKEQVTVEPFCGRDGFTEERCVDCGAAVGERILDKGSALTEHHYVHFDETYYTYTGDGEDKVWNSGNCYVCTVCGFAIEEPTVPKKNDQESAEEFEERQKEYEEELKIWEHAKETAGHVYESKDSSNVDWKSDENGNIISATISGNVICDCCYGKLLDALMTDENKMTSFELSDPVTLTEISKTTKGNCVDGLTTNYVATGTTQYVDEKGNEKTVKLIATKSETAESTNHPSYEADFKWKPIEDENAEVPYEVTVTQIKCKACGTVVEGTIEVNVKLNKEKSQKPTCTEAGYNSYTATAVVRDKNGEPIAETSEDHTEDSDIVNPTGHNYNAEWKWEDTVPSVELTCTEGDIDPISSFKVGDGDEDIHVDIDKSQSTATCESAGVIVYKASLTYDGQTFESEPHNKTVDKLNHQYEADWTWNEKESAGGQKTGEVTSVTAIIKCVNGCDFTLNDVKASVTKVDNRCVKATCNTEGKNVYNAIVTFTDADGDEKTLSTDKDFIVPKLGHNYSNPTWAWSKDYKTATATSTCANCGNKEGPQNAKVSYAVTTSPTYTAGGAGVYTATCTINGKSYTDTKKINLPKLSAEAVLDRSSASVTAGDKISVTLNSKYANDAITSVTLDNKAFATVAFSGKSMTISGVSAGTTKATVKTASNETLTITITVKKPVSVTSFTSAVKKIKKDGNASGSVFGTLSARVSKAGRTSITLKWNKVSGADGYIIYGNKCGTKYKFTKVATVKKTKTTYAKKKLKKGTYYKFIVAAYKKVNGKQVILSTSKTLHAVTSGTKYVNPKSLKVNATRVTLNQGTTYSLKATEVIQKAKKSKKHRRVAFESSNSQVASVSSGGTVTAKRRGSCTIYVYAQNGIYKKVQVTVN